MSNQNKQHEAGAGRYACACVVCTSWVYSNGNDSLHDFVYDLRDYMYFVDLVRDYHVKNGFLNLEDAIHQAIEQCIRENVLRDFLIEHRAEVMHVMTLDFTFERRLEMQREERSCTTI